jgi:hypothetical protein
MDDQHVLVDEPRRRERAQEFAAAEDGEVGAVGLVERSDRVDRLAGEEGECCQSSSVTGFREVTNFSTRSGYSVKGLPSVWWGQNDAMWW